MIIVHVHVGNVKLFHGFHYFISGNRSRRQETHEGIPLKYIFLSDLLVVRSLKFPKVTESNWNGQYIKVLPYLSTTNSKSMHESQCHL